MSYFFFQNQPYFSIHIAVRQLAADRQFDATKQFDVARQFDTTRQPDTTAAIQTWRIRNTRNAGNE